MSGQRCPYCGELVPPNSVNCPKCYRNLPSEVFKINEEEKKAEKAEKRSEAKRTIGLILAIIPGFIGILGLGQLYYGRKRGFVLLLLGACFFFAGIALVMFIPPFSIILAIPMFVIYALLFIASLIDLSLGSLFIRV